MNTRFLSSKNHRFNSGQSKITNVPANAGFINKTMMKKFTLFFTLMMFAISGVFAQLPGGPVTTAGTKIEPIHPAYPVTVSIPITANNFNNIGGMSLTIGFNPAVLQVASVIPNPLFTPVVPSVGINNTTGVITIGWYDPNEVSLGNDVLFTLNFNYYGGTSLISFLDPTGIECEYTDGTSLIYLGDTYNNGYVTDLSATATYSNICAPGNVGVITVTATGGSGVYEYSIDNGGSWFGNAAPPYSPYSFTGLAPGVYPVKVRDMALSLPLVTISVTTLTPPVHNITQNTYYCFIQDAVNAAINGDDIEVVLFPWTFNENVTINKSVTITGDPLNPANAVIDGSATGSVVTITANNVQLKGFTVQNSGAGTTDGGIVMNNVTGAVIQNNIVTSNTNGFIVNGSGVGNLISLNQIFGNGLGMLLNLTSPTEKVNASLNYWGDPTGPYNAIHNSCGLGNGVSDMVTFHPWYTTAAMTTTATLPIYNVNKDTYYCEIQDAADHADNNNLIHFLLPGDFGNLNFDYSPVTKTLDVINVSAGTVTMHGSTKALTVANGSISFTGVDFTTAANDATILVSGGKLKLRGCNVYESTVYDNTGVLITGGELDAGTSPTDPGYNRFLSDGNGLSMNNTGGVVNAICNFWGSNFYMVIFPKITGTVSYDPWSDQNFTMCDVLTRFGGPITYAPKVITTPGPVTLPITVDRFNNVDAISLTLQYDPAIIQFTGFTANAVFPGMTVNIPVPGTAIIGWFNTTPVTYLPDGSTIVDLHFNFFGGTSLLEWQDPYSVDCEYQNALIQYPYIDTPQAAFYYDGWITDLAAKSVSSTNVICKGTASGTITINGSSGGSGAYEYSVDGGATWQSSNIFYLPFGTYDVWIRDANFPIIMIQLDPLVIITEPALPLSATANWTKRVRCKGENNGEALVTPVGGWGGYTYLWNDPLAQTTAAADSMFAGFYTATVTDAGGCSVTASTFVIEPTIAFTASVTSTVVSCKGGSNGTITVNAAHGWGYYMYSINNITYYNYLTSNTITGLPAGNYTVHIFDDERCELVLPVSIQEPTVALTASAAETKPVSCYGLADGEVTVYPNGGWGSYEFSLDGVNYQTYPGNVISGLTAGIYTVYVKDLYNCVVTAPVTVTQPAPFTASISGDNTICYGDPSTVTVNIVGGNAPYDILVTDGTNNESVTGYMSTSWSFTKNYTASTTWNWGIITDNNNCPAVTSGSATINVNPLPAIGFTFKSLAGTGSVFDYCYDELVTVTLSHVWAGTGPFDIAWTVNGSPSSATGVNLGDPLFSGYLTPGTYVVNITYIEDANGCTPTTYAPYTATVNVHGEPMISFGFNGVEAGHNPPPFEYCYDVPVGVTLYEYYGGTAPYFVTYEVNGVTTTVGPVYKGDPIFPSQILAPGTYNIVVTDITDANNCKAGTSFLSLATATVIINPEPIISFGFNGVEAGHNASFEYCYNETVEVTLHTEYFGTAPYTVTYEVNGVTTTVTNLSASSIISPAQLYLPGVYNIVVTDITDAKGCKASAAFLSLCTATLTINAEPIISFGFNGQEAAGPNFTKEYCFNEPVHVTLFKEYYGVAPYEVTYELDGVTSTVTLLSAGSTLFGPQTLPAGVYNIVVTKIKDAKGCEASTSFLYLCTATITVHPEPAVGFTFKSLAGTGSIFDYCYDENVNVTLSHIWAGTPPFDISWTVSDGTGPVTSMTYSGAVLGTTLFNNLFAPGNYTVQITSIVDAKGCSPASYAPYIAYVNVHPEPTITIPSDVYACSFAPTVDLPYSATTNGTDMYMIVFDNAALSQGFINVPTTLLPASPISIAVPPTAYPGYYNATIYAVNSINGCISQGVPFKINIPYPFQASAVEISPVSCNGGSDGVATVYQTGGWSPYTYLWDDPAAQTTAVATGLSAGMYTVIVYDAHGCTTTSYVYITEPDALGASVTTTDITCNGADDGIITISNPIGGHGTYEFSIDGTTWQSGLVFSGLAPLTYTVWIRDAAYTSCTMSLGNYTINEPVAITVSGYFNYYNAPETPLNNIAVSLWQGTNLIYTLSPNTDLNGYYLFPNVCPGTYEVHASTVKPVGGINATDATQANIWGLAPTSIEKVNFLAGDVIFSNTVNAADAGRILQYFVTSGNPPFSVSPWMFWKAYDYISVNNFTDGAYPVISVAASNVIQNFYGLVTGDFNRSFVPSGAKSSGSITLTNDGSVVAGDNSEIVIPVTAVNELDLTAISLILQYPADKIEIIGVNLPDKSPLLFTANNGNLRIAFASVNPLSVKAGGTILEIKVKTLPALVSGESALFVLSNDVLNEFAGLDYQPLINPIINIVGIEGTVSIDKIDPQSNIGLTNYPNPFNGITAIQYTLPVDGYLSLEMFDLVGRKIDDLYTGNQSAGIHQVTFDGSTLNPGVYMVSLKLRNNTSTLTKTIRIVNQ